MPSSAEAFLTAAAASFPAHFFLRQHSSSQQHIAPFLPFLKPSEPTLDRLRLHASYKAIAIELATGV
jgi:hypothetical protein